MLTEKFLAGRRRSRFSDDEKQALESAVSRVREYAPHQLIVREGDRPRESSYLVEGMACRFLDSEDGGRQYVGLHVPGDFVDLHAFPLERLDHSVIACTTVRMALVPHEALSNIMNTMPHLACMLWTSTLMDAAIHRNWIMCLGRLPALSRIAHLLCELNVRMQLVGLSDGSRFDLPLRQEDLADATGLTPVHVNRMLRELRELSLAEFRQGRVAILDWPGLQRAAEFDPAYLYADDSPTIRSMGQNDHRAERVAR